MMMTDTVSPSTGTAPSSPSFYQGRPFAQYATSATGATAGVLGAHDLAAYAAAGLPVIAGTTQYMLPPPAVMSKYTLQQTLPGE